MSKVKFEDLPKIRKKHKDTKIVFCSGCFDLTHAGHVIFFEDCKAQGDLLVVGIGTDSSIKKYKGDKRPILNENVRLKIVDSLKPVDYTVFDGDVFDPKNKFVLLDMVFKALRPDVYVVNEDAFDIDERQKISDKFGVKIVILKRWCPPEFGDLSTTSIIKKILE